MNKEIRKKKTPSIGIAFGGGAVRGFAHIGVLEALSEAEDERLMPQLIAGTSTGSIMGALYASGLSVETIKTESEKIGWSREVVDVSQSIIDSLHNLTGLLLPGSLENWLKDAMGADIVIGGSGSGKAQAAPLAGGTARCFGADGSDPCERRFSCCSFQDGHSRIRSQTDTPILSKSGLLVAFGTSF